MHTDLAFSSLPSRAVLVGTHLHFLVGFPKWRGSSLSIIAEWHVEDSHSHQGLKSDIYIVGQQCRSR